MELLKNICKLESLTGRLGGKKVFLRADFNVPIKSGKITDTFRIDSTLATLRFLQDQGAITIIVSHIETKDVESSTLKPVYEYLAEKYPEFVVHFCSDFENETVVSDMLTNAREGEFILFENIRNAKGEKENSSEFAEYLKKFVDVYINDAFAVSHRAHASVDALPKLFVHECKVVGDQLYKEIVHLSEAVVPQKPFAVILSGAKFSTKLPLIQKYLSSSDVMLIGGALFNNIAKSLGHEVGVSLIDTDVPYLDQLVKESEFISKVFIPEIVVVKDTLSGAIRTCGLTEVSKTETIQDIAEESISAFMEKVGAMEVKTILWNGPVGNYEDIDFTKGTVMMAEKIFAYIEKNTQAHAILGGGDTVAAIQKVEGIAGESRIFVSTGGGAMLEFLEKDGQLPGIVSLL